MSDVMVRYPDMRREVALAVEHLADPEYQRRVWVERTYPSPNYHDDLSMTIHTLYDDTGIATDVQREIGATLLNEREAGLMQKVVRALDDVLAEVGDQAPDHVILGSDRWPRVVAAAADAWREMSGATGGAEAAPDAGRSAPLVTGTVVENVAGAEYEGVVYDRWLTVRLADGRRVDVFDPGPPIGESLTAGTLAEFALVAAIPTKVRIDGGGEPDRLWQDEVVDAAWRPTPDTLDVLRPELTEFPWVVVETSIGGLLLSPTDLPEGVREGASVSWDGRRLDLFGFTRTAP
jgi:hypothetical protein